MNPVPSILVFSRLLPLAHTLRDLGRRGFLHGAVIPLLWLVGAYKLWFSSKIASLDRILFSDSFGLPDRFGPDLPSWVGLVLGGAFLHLAWMVAAARFDKKRPRLDLLLPGIAWALATYGCVMQLGAAISTARRMDSPWHFALLDAFRWVVFGFASLAILASALRAVGVEPRRIGRFALLAGSVVVVSSGFLGAAGSWLCQWRDWRDARAIGTAMAMNGFVRAHPTSPHVEEARRLVWGRVVAKPDLARIRLYLEHAADWGDRLDSARILERKALASLRRAARSRRFSDDSLVDGFWRSRIPDPESAGSGTRIVRYKVLQEPFDPLRQSRDLSRLAGREVFAPDSGFDPFETDGRDRLVEDLLESVVRGWAGPELLTIAPWKDSDTAAPDIVVRFGSRIRGPLEPVPCEPGCPPADRRWMLPSLGYVWSMELDLGGGRAHRARGEVADTTSLAIPQDQRESDDPSAYWPEGLDLEGAWAMLRSRSQGLLAGSLREAWKLCPGKGD